LISERDKRGGEEGHQGSKEVLQVRYRMMVQYIKKPKAR
jgi:hypothetical protein